MKKKWNIVLVSWLVTAAILILAGCSVPKAQASAAYDAVWVTPTITGDTVTIPIDSVTTNHNVHFNVDTVDGTMTFMVYENGGKTGIRASICVPCRSRSFTLKNSQLICDSCGTVFSADTGLGVSGACVGYPKASVTFETNGNNIIMSKVNLTKAFDDTMSPGLP